jgi:hypothetical protein
MNLLKTKPAPASVTLPRNARQTRIASPTKSELVQKRGAANANTLRRQTAPPVYKPQAPQPKNSVSAAKTSSIDQRRPLGAPVAVGSRTWTGSIQAKRPGPSPPRVPQLSPVNHRFARSAAETLAGAFLRSATIQRAAARVYGPVNLIPWDDLVSSGRDHGLITKDLDDGSQLLGPNPMAYPHFHLWRNGKVAFSYAHNKNYKVGENQKLDLDTLRDELTRYVGQKVGEVFDFVAWLNMVSN